jgi:hypothetical protein
MEVVKMMESMPNLQSVSTIFSIADLYNPFFESSTDLQAIGKAFSVVARRLKRLVFASSVVSVSGKSAVSFADMPQCVEITLHSHDLAESSAISKWKDEKAPSEPWHACWMHFHPT